MSDEPSFDVAGIGKAAKAIPAKAWVQLVDTACITFRQVIAPLTALTSGTGRLIEAKFDRLVDAEKVLVSDTLANAAKKVKASGRPIAETPSARVVVAVIENSSSETNPLLRELWANLLAQEFTTGQVHPEFPNLLARLSADDAQVLAGVAQYQASKNTRLVKTVNDLLSAFKILGLSLKFHENQTYAHEHLVSLGLIRFDRGAWELTLMGEAFLKAVGGELSGA